MIEPVLDGIGQQFSGKIGLKDGFQHGAAFVAGLVKTLALDRLSVLSRHMALYRAQ